MATPFSCKCEERKKPLSERHWIVVEHKWNSGRFVKAGGEPSDYSTIYVRFK